MTLTHIVAEDLRGRMVPIYLFECEKSEKDWPKVAGFLFDRRSGIAKPAKRWTTPDWQLAKKLIQYADDQALTALQSDGVLDLDQARRNAIKREKSLASKEQNELASMWSPSGCTRCSGGWATPKRTPESKAM